MSDPELDFILNKKKNAYLALKFVMQTMNK
jgi:hypothetical protein